MSTWSVVVKDAMGSSTIASFENGIDTSTRAVALRGFDPPIVTPPGSGKVLNLYARQDRVACPPRGIIQFSIDGTPVFWGPAVVTPALDSPGAGPFDADRDALERITVVGGEQLLKDTVTGPRLFEDEIDVAAIALEFCTLYAHPALGVDYMNFPDTGGVLAPWYLPEQTLFDALQKLSDAVPGGASFWVDANGYVHFEAISG